MCIPKDNKEYKYQGVDKKGMNQAKEPIKIGKGKTEMFVCVECKRCWINYTYAKYCCFNILEEDRTQA